VPSFSNEGSGANVGRDVGAGVGSADVGRGVGAGDIVGAGGIVGPQRDDSTSHTLQI